jgi:hypothetical protein
MSSKNRELREERGVCEGEDATDVGRDANEDRSMWKLRSFGIVGSGGV